MIVVYHANCFDGFTAAWVAHKRHPDAEFIPMNYGDDPDTVFSRINAQSEVVMVDFSLPRRELELLRSRVRSLVILDHHKTAEEALAGFPGATFNMNKSGAQLAWDYFFPLDRSQKPPLVDYVADRDLWRFELPGSREINAFIQATDFTFADYDAISAFLLLKPTNALALGAAILQAQGKLVKQIVAQAAMVSIAGTKVPMANSGPLLMSEVGEALLAAYPEAPFAGYYFDRADEQRQFGLRSRNTEDVDVSAIAKKYGGGGHKHAAGFQTRVPQRLQ